MSLKSLKNKVKSSETRAKLGLTFPGDLKNGAQFHSGNPDVNIT
jgi:cell wall assembly regulator SMI1